MRKLIAIVATTLVVLGTPAVAFAGHKEGHHVPPGAAKNNPTPSDCAIEVDPLGLCIG